MKLAQVDKMQYRNKHKAGTLAQCSQILAFVWADLARLLKLDVLHPEAITFFTNIIKREITERKNTGKKRNDFIGAMMQVIFQYLLKIGFFGRQMNTDLCW